jgi:MFS family permease
MWLLSLGPAPTFLDRPIIYDAPYAWLMLLPGVEGIRVPARFWMLAALCLAGLQSAFFGPIKYSILPQMLHETEIVGGNALVESGTFVAILAGTLAGGYLAALQAGPAAAGSPHDSIALFRATEHRRPLFNGYSGFAPHYWPIQYLIGSTIRRLTRLSSFGPLEVVSITSGIRSRAAKLPVERPQTSLIYQDDRYSAFRSNEGPMRSRCRSCEGQALPIASIAAEFNAATVGAMIDHDIMTRWLRPRATAGRQLHRGSGSDAAGRGRRVDDCRIRR